MNKYLKISNRGRLNTAIISLMGGTTKEGLNTIGEFGTGLKYALAHFLKNNINIRIFIDNDEQVVKAVPTDFGNNTTFNVIHINGKETSITTNMGKDWELWMCIREIYSNALDEGLLNCSIVNELEEWKHDENQTTFYIEATVEVMNIYNNWNNYFITTLEPITEFKVPYYGVDICKIYIAKGPLRIYKQGILIKEYTDKKSLFNYDFSNASINELREFTGNLHMCLSYVIVSISDKKLIDYLVQSWVTDIEEEYIESKIDIDDHAWGSWKVSDEWKNHFNNAKIVTKEVLDKLKGANPNFDFSDVIQVPKKVYDWLRKGVDNITLTRAVNKVKEFFEVYDAELELKNKQALTILEEVGYFIHPELKFIYGEFGDKNIFAQINLDTKEIFISQKMKDKSLFKFCTMLVEENEHFQTGFSDNSREFQQHFIDLYVKTMLDKANVKL